MPAEYLVSELLSAVREEGFLPTADEASADRLLGTLNREQRTYLAHVLLSAREEFQTAQSVIALDGSSQYRVPTRAVGAKLKQVFLRDSSGNDSELFPAPLGRKGIAKATGTGQYAFNGLTVELFDTTATGSLVLRYYRRLNRLVDETETAAITDFDSGARTVTIAAVPDGWVVGATAYDFVQGNPHFDVLGVSQSATRASLVLTFATALPEDLAVGDYVALAGETPICNAPLELHDLLVARAVWMYWLGQGDPKAAAAKDRYQELEQRVLALISPRVTDSDVVLVNYDAPGWSRWRAKRRF